MTSSTHGVARLGLLLLFGSLLVAGHARAACPDQLCDCLGEAAGYRAVAADRLRAGIGLALDTNPPMQLGSIIAGDLCAGRADLAESANDSTEIQGDLYVFAGAGSRAVRSRIAGPDGANTVLVSGVIATGGGSVFGPVTANAIDTTGTHPGIASCQQAVGDMLAASQTLAALPATQIFDTIIAPVGEDLVVNAGPGVNVINVAGKVTAWGNLRFVLAPATDAVVVNAKTLFVSGAVSVEGGDETKVVINLTGRGRAVLVKTDATVAPLLLAPERVVKVSPRGDIAGALARRVFFGGSFASQLHDVCPAASPSGAFVDAPAPF